MKDKRGSSTVRHGLPDSVRSIAGSIGSGKDWVVEVLREYFEDQDIDSIPVITLMRSDQRNPIPMLLVTEENFPDMYNNTPPYTQTESIGVDAFAAGPNCNPRSRELATVALDVLQQAFERHHTLECGGYISRLRIMDRPVIGDDWGPTLGPVQFADSPQEVARSRTLLILTFCKGQRIGPYGT